MKSGCFDSMSPLIIARLASCLRRERNPLMFQLSKEREEGAANEDKPLGAKDCPDRLSKRGSTAIRQQFPRIASLSAVYPREFCCESCFRLPKVGGCQGPFGINE